MQMMFSKGNVSLSKSLFRLLLLFLIFDICSSIKEMKNPTIVTQTTFANDAAHPETHASASVGVGVVSHPYNLQQPEFFILNDKCSTCQETIYQLMKIYTLQINTNIGPHYQNVECKTKRDPQVCATINSQFFSSGIGLPYVHLRNGNIKICDTCFRLKYCEINTCKYEEALLKNIIKKTLNSYKDYHYINKSNALKHLINTKSDSYFTSMDTIMVKFAKIYNNIPKYELNYRNSITMKKYFKVLLGKLLAINKINMINTNFALDVDLEQSIQWSKDFVYLKAINDYYEELKTHKFHYIDNKIYVSDNIHNDIVLADNIINFETKVKAMIDLALSYNERFRQMIEGILQEIKTLGGYLDILSNDKIDLRTKVNLLNKDGKNLFSSPLLKEKKEEKKEEKALPPPPPKFKKKRNDLLVKSDEMLRKLNSNVTRFSNLTVYENPLLNLSNLNDTDSDNPQPVITHTNTIIIKKKIPERKNEEEAEESKTSTPDSGSKAKENENEKDDKNEEKNEVTQSKEIKLAPLRRAKADESEEKSKDTKKENNQNVKKNPKPKSAKSNGSKDKDDLTDDDLMTDDDDDGFDSFDGLVSGDTKGSKNKPKKIETKNKENIAAEPKAFKAKSFQNTTLSHQTQQSESEVKERQQHNFLHMDHKHINEPSLIKSQQKSNPSTSSTNAAEKSKSKSNQDTSNVNTSIPNLNLTKDDLDVDDFDDLTPEASGFSESKDKSGSKTSKVSNQPTESIPNISLHSSTPQPEHPFPTSTVNYENKVHLPASPTATQSARQEIASHDHDSSNQHALPSSRIVQNNFINPANNNVTDILINHMNRMHNEHASDHTNPSQSMQQNGNNNINNINNPNTNPLKTYGPVPAILPFSPPVVLPTPGIPGAPVMPGQVAGAPLLPVIPGMPSPALPPSPPPTREQIMKMIQDGVRQPEKPITGFNKDVFKPDPKLSNIASLLLGLNKNVPLESDLNLHKLEVLQEQINYITKHYNLLRRKDHLHRQFSHFIVNSTHNETDDDEEEEDEDDDDKIRSSGFGSSGSSNGFGSSGSSFGSSSSSSNMHHHFIQKSEIHKGEHTTTSSPKTKNLRGKSITQNKDKKAPLNPDFVSPKASENVTKKKEELSRLQKELVKLSEIKKEVKLDESLKKDQADLFKNLDSISNNMKTSENYDELNEDNLFNEKLSKINEDIKSIKDKDSKSESSNPKKKSIKEIKDYTKNFLKEIDSQIKKLDDPKEVSKEAKKQEEKIKSEDEEYSKKRKEEKSLKEKVKNSKSLISSLEQNLRNLDEEFYDVRHKLLINLMR